jgi:hypothetical protein
MRDGDSFLRAKSISSTRADESAGRGMGKVPQGRLNDCKNLSAYLFPQHFLNFLPLLQGHLSLG